MNNLLNSYLMYLTEVAKWKEKVDSGGVSPAGVQKLKQTGVIKPWSQYAKGVGTGTSNILRKTGTQIVRSPAKNTPTYGGIVNRAKGTVGTYVTSPKKTRTSGIVGQRHEADEARTKARLMKRYGTGVQGGIVFGSTKGKKLQLHGTHASPEVLRKEKKLTDYMSKAYPEKSYAKHVSTHRKQTGEEKIASLPRKDIKK